jgi:hypothetical protein
MAFTASGVFIQWPYTMLNGTKPTGYNGVTTDTLKAALYNNTGTPNKSDTLAHSAYNGSGSPWVTANEVTDTNWAAGGRSLASVTNNVSSNVITLDAADTSGGGNVTMSGIMGCLVYDSSITGGTGVANQGICFNYFGGAQSVSSGTFTIVWNASGIMTTTA